MQKCTIGTAFGPITIKRHIYLDREAEDGDLIHMDDEEKADEDGISIITMWNGERKNYFIKE